MSTGSGISAGSGVGAPRTGSNWGIRFAVAAIGASVSWWFASRQDIHKLHPLPLLNQRLIQAAPILLAGTAGIIFSIWIIFLLREAKARSARQFTTVAGSENLAERTQWNAIQWLVFAAIVSTIALSVSSDILKFLWPSYPLGHFHATGFTSEMIALLGLVLDSPKKKRKQVSLTTAGSSVEPEPWAGGRYIRLAVVMLAGVGLALYVHSVAKTSWPSHLRTIDVFSALAITALMFSVARKKPEGDPKYAPLSDFQTNTAGQGGNAASQKKWVLNAIAFLIAAAILAVNLSPVRPEVKKATFYAPFVILALFSALAYALSFLKRRIYLTAKTGGYDRALRANRFWSRIPGYGSSLEGPILFTAGRYQEALSFLRPLAFDWQGKPKLTTTDLYVYCLALVNSGQEAKAQELLEMAVQVPQKGYGKHVALATCLLGQKKDPERARQLLELALATPDAQSYSYGRTTDHLMRLGRYAWALAACGRREAAEAQLGKAFASSNMLKDRDLAGLHYFAGETWRSLREWKKARASFDEALRLSPDGPAATGAMKAMAKMREEAQS